MRKKQSRTSKAGETSYKETVFGIIPRSKLIPLEIEGVKRSWDFILEEKQKGEIPFTPHFLQKVHKVGFGWIFPQMAGKFRTIQVKVSHHQPPLPYQVPLLMKDFTEDLKVRLKHLPDLQHLRFLEEFVELLAWAHHRFLWIHPFVDYNGRIGRLLINMILLNLNLPPIELKIETENGRINYVKALQKADAGSYDALEKLIWSALKEAAKDFAW